LGASQTILIVAEKDVPTMSISLPISGNHLTDIVAEKFKISFEEAEKLKKTCGLDPKKCDNKLLPIVDSYIKDICKKIYDALKTYPGLPRQGAAKAGLPGNKKRQPIILAGGGANMFKLDSVLSRDLKIKVRKGTPTQLWKIESKNENFNASQLAAATVTGLALRARLYPCPNNH
jgi:Tfp pilus assembly PilM family ATPase